jgi:glutathione synthase/RimK-type ligase-like ATP-grasp enzyme
MTDIAFVTCAEYADLTEDDRLVVAVLRAGGHEVDPTRWDDAGVAWERYDAIVLRSTWDYHRRLPEFLRWIDRLDRAGCPLFNPPALLRWNSDKRYLLELTAAPLAPPSTRLFGAGSRIDVAALLRELDTREAVIKPAVSANAYGTSRVGVEDLVAAQSAIDDLLARADVIVQPLIPELRTEGELSLMFLGRTFSHAVRKLPAAGEFRVQETLGGRAEPCVVSSSLRAGARRLLDGVAPDTLYARVDLVETASRPMLMEIELIEPSLFLFADPDAPARFAAAIETCVRRTTEC